MKSLGDIFSNALLADAVYAFERDGLEGTTGADLVRLLPDRMTPALARYIGENFTVLTNSRYIAIDPMVGPILLHRKAPIRSIHDRTF